MYKILIKIDDHTACSYYRSILPWTYCHQELLSEGIQLDMSEKLNGDLEYDCYIFHRLMNDSFWSVLWDMKFHAKKKIVWDTDDNLFHIPSWSPARHQMTSLAKKTMMACLEWADDITVTTDRFKDQLGAWEPWKDKITVLPNLMSMDDWSLPEYTIKSGPKRILWAGSLTHQKDLEIVVPAIIDIAKEYKDEVQFAFIGMMPDELKMSKNNKINNILNRSIVYINNCDLGYYPKVMSFLAPDIAFTPIEDNKFNNAKSNIKYLEMSLAGAMCISSDVGPYKDTIKNNEDGILSPNTTEDWYHSFRYALDTSPKDLKRMNLNAQIKVREQYSWDSNQKYKWMNFFRELARKEVAIPSR